VVFGRGQMECLPAERRCSRRIDSRAERVTALQRDRMVEHMQDAQGSSRHRVLHA
jgi:hypothetical protein